MKDELIEMELPEYIMEIKEATRFYDAIGYMLRDINPLYRLKHVVENKILVFNVQIKNAFNGKEN